MIIKNKVFHGDCLELLKEIPDNSVHAIICDLPYGGKLTEAKWDCRIDPDALWKEYLRVTTKEAAICLFSTQTFTTDLINSNRSMYRYSWYWRKNKASNFIQARNQPMRCIEEICVFGKVKCVHESQNVNGRLRYFPQGVVKREKPIKVKQSVSTINSGARKNRKNEYENELTGFPNHELSDENDFYSTYDVLDFDNNLSKDEKLHPTQKPVKLLEYLIKTYTLEGEIVLDNTCGSGSLPIACLNTNRNYIAMEKDIDYYNVTVNRILRHKGN